MGYTSRSDEFDHVVMIHKHIFKLLLIVLIFTLINPTLQKSKKKKKKVSKDKLKDRLHSSETVQTKAHVGLKKAKSREIRIKHIESVLNRLDDADIFEDRDSTNLDISSLEHCTIENNLASCPITEEMLESSLLLSE